MTFIDNRNEVKAALKRSCVKSIIEACGELVSQAERNSKVVTGKTKGSYQYKVDEDKLEGFVGSNYENAIWEEFGQVRTLTIDNEPWFVGKDIAEALGYSNTSKAVVNHVDNEDKQFMMINIADSQNGNVPIGQSKTAIINESGLYSLILSSKLPNAKKFKRWVTSEVLPAIRKTGHYEAPGYAPKATSIEQIYQVTHIKHLYDRYMSLHSKKIMLLFQYGTTVSG